MTQWFLLVFQSQQQKNYIRLDRFSSSFAEITDVKNSESDSPDCGNRTLILIYTTLNENQVTFFFLILLHNNIHLRTFEDNKGLLNSANTQFFRRAKKAVRPWNSCERKATTKQRSLVKRSKQPRKEKSVQCACTAIIETGARIMDTTVQFAPRDSRPPFCGNILTRVTRVGEVNIMGVLP